MHYDDLHSDFGRRIKLVRIARDMTQEEMAALLSYSSSAISDFEMSKRDPTTKQVRTFAETLGVPFEWLCGWGPDFSYELESFP